MTATLQPGLDKGEGYEQAMMAMIMLGVGELCGCLVIGHVIDRKGNRFAALVDMMIVIGMTLITLAYLQVRQFNFLAYLMPFAWGFQDSAVNTHLHEIMGFEFGP